MSFNIALSGLNASNKDLNTISNNIANSGTTGFKGSRTEFGSVYNGSQAGGVQVIGISQNFDQTGSITGTGRGLDLALTSGGFFVTEDSKGQVTYTRNGTFSTDQNGYIVSNTGSKLQGYSVDGDNNLQQGNVGALQIDTSNLQAQATNSATFAANLDAREDVIDTTAYPFDPTDINSYTSSYTTPVYDSLGNEHTVSQYFVKTADNAWEVHSVVDGDTANATVTPMTFDENGQFTGFATTDADGNSTTTFKYDIAANPAGAAPLNIEMDMSGMSQYGSDFVVSTNAPNGYSAGEYADVRIESNGMVYATYSNGQSLLQGQLVLANFAAPQELMQANNTSWTQTFGSGQPIIGVPGTGMFGEVASGALEGSNVDLTNELVNLMTAQRNYQANTKTISTADQLTQALFNAI